MDLDLIKREMLGRTKILDSRYQESLKCVPWYFSSKAQCSFEEHHYRVPLIPEVKRIIFNAPATIVYWKDGSKTIVKASNEPFHEEHGLAMAYMKKIFNSRGEFLRTIKNAERPSNVKKEKNV